MRISLYYPFALTNFVSFRKTEDYDRTGEVLLTFEDSAHCLVTVRLERRTLDALCKRVERAPDPPSVPE